MNFSEKYPKIRDTKKGTSFSPQLWTFFRKIAQYTIQRVICVLGYSKIKTFKIVIEIIMCPFCSAPK